MYRLQVRPKTRFSSDFWIQEGTRNVTLLDLARLRTRGEFLLEGTSWDVRSSGLLRREYRLERDGRVEARATRVQILPLLYRVHAGDRLLELRSVPPLRRTRVLHGGREIGVIAPVRVFSRFATAEFREPLRTEIQVFLIALALLRWRAQARSAGSGGG